MNKKHIPVAMTVIFWLFLKTRILPKISITTIYIVMIAIELKTEAILPRGISVFSVQIMAHITRLESPNTSLHSVTECSITETNTLFVCIISHCYYLGYLGGYFDTDSSGLGLATHTAQMA